MKRQERRRLERLRKNKPIIDKSFKPDPKILCPFDNNPCSRPRSDIDGDLQCGGIQYSGDLTHDEMVDVVPPCERLRPENMRWKAA
jgi:hypothetical protein